MAKLSDLKKVELLEEKVINNDIDGVKAVFSEYSPIEFTARALGLACRFVGAGMVKTLIECGATFTYTLTPVLKRKYNCAISINKFDDLPVNYVWCLFPKYRYGMSGYSNNIISDEERIKVLNALHNMGMGDFTEILYYAILYNDSVIYDELIKLGVNELSVYRTDIASGRIPMNRLDSYGRSDRREFQEALHEYDSKELKTMLTNFMSCMKVDKITLFPSDLFVRDWSNYSETGGVFISKYCSEPLFDFFVNKTNMLDKVKKWDLISAIVEQNNPSAMQYALKENWLTKPKDIDALLKHVQEQKDISPELIGYVIEKQHQVGDPEKKNPENMLSLDDKSLSATELKKIWGTKKLDDGTLIITSYKGEDKNVVIPSQLGKTAVTAIDPDTFNPDVARLNDIQQNNRKNIVSVVFPGTIREIPSNMFVRPYSGKKRGALNRVILGEGTEKICDRAFSGCSGIKEIVIPNSVQEIGKNAFEGCSGIEEIVIPDSVRVIGQYAFTGCTNLKRITIPKHICVLPEGIFSYTGFESFAVSDQFVTIGDSAFRGCKKLQSVRLPETITEIPRNMFQLCESLESIDLPKGITTIGDSAFELSGLIECKIPDNVKYIGDKAFSGCKALKNVVLPKETEIGLLAFSGCGALADESDKIVVRGVFYGIANEYGRLSPELLVKPLIFDESIIDISIPIKELPQIVCREYKGDDGIIDIDSVSVGEEVEFGRFPVADDYILHPLKWRILAKENGMALLITSDEIISLQEDIKQRGVWADSRVRELLNEGFLDTAFTDAERTQICKITVNTPKNKKCRIDGGPDTEDRVFLLSMDEVEKYFPDEESRKSLPTEYAKKQDYMNSFGKYQDVGFWQLRTPGDGWGSVAVSNYNGDFSAMTGNHVGHSYVRPAMWIKNV